jgi:CheY-like chemotaxis protein
MPTVLVVDDEGTVRELTARILRHAGYSTVEAADGREAWQCLHRSGVAIDVVVSDVVMPHMTGTELLMLLRETRPTIPVLLMSAYSPEELRARGMDECRVAVLSKPFGHDQLVSLVQQLLSNRQSQAN